jgi:hypothetical protein
MAESIAFLNKNGGVRWELLVSDRHGVHSWATLPDDTCATIEAAKTAGRSSVLMNDEQVTCLATRPRNCAASTAQACTAPFRNPALVIRSPAFDLPQGRLSRALLADFEECLETIGGELRRLRRRELPPLVLPSCEPTRQARPSLCPCKSSTRWRGSGSCGTNSAGLAAAKPAPSSP